MFLHPSVCPQGGRCYDVTSCYGQHSTPPPPGQQEGGTHPTGMLSCFLFMTCQPSFHILGDIYINYTLNLSSCNKSTLLPASTKLGQGNIFTSVCLSTGGRGVCLSACWDTHPPPGADHPPSGADPPPPPREADCSIRLTSGRYASYWNAQAFYFQRTASGSSLYVDLTQLDLFNSGRYFEDVKCLQLSL